MKNQNETVGAGELLEQDRVFEAAVSLFKEPEYGADLVMEADYPAKLLKTYVTFAHKLAQGKSIPQTWSSPNFASKLFDTEHFHNMGGVIIPLNTENAVENKGDQLPERILDILKRAEAHQLALNTVPTMMSENRGTLHQVSTLPTQVALKILMFSLEPPDFMHLVNHHIMRDEVVPVRAENGDINYLKKRQPNNFPLFHDLVASVENMSDHTPPSLLVDTHAKGDLDLPPILAIAKTIRDRRQSYLSDPKLEAEFLLEYFKEHLYENIRPPSDIPELLQNIARFARYVPYKHSLGQSRLGISYSQVEAAAKNAPFPYIVNNETLKLLKPNRIQRAIGKLRVMAHNSNVYFEGDKIKRNW